MSNRWFPGAILRLAAATLCFGPAVPAAAGPPNPLLDEATTCLDDWTRSSMIDYPCIEVHPGDQYVIVWDEGGAKRGVFMLLATDPKLVGVESPGVLDPPARDFFASGWAYLSKAIDSDQVHRLGMAINNPSHRSEEHFHIHLACARQDYQDAIESAIKSGRLTRQWGKLTANAEDYDAMLLDDPSRAFELVKDLAASNKASLGDYSIAVLCHDGEKACSQFVLLATTGSGEQTLEEGDSCNKPTQ